MEAFWRRRLLMLLPASNYIKIDVFSNIATPQPSPCLFQLEEIWHEMLDLVLYFQDHTAQEDTQQPNQHSVSPKQSSALCWDLFYKIAFLNFDFLWEVLRL